MVESTMVLQKLKRVNYVKTINDDCYGNDVFEPELYWEVDGDDGKAR